MSGLFHSLKKAAAKGDARPDSEFLDAKARFDQYEATLLKLRGNVHTYIAHASGLLVVASQISQDFTTLLDDPQAQINALANGGTSGTEGGGAHEYSAALNSSRMEHSALASEHVPRLSGALQSKIVAELEKEMALTADLSKRIARRMELFGELGYYQRKVNELRDERDKRLSKGKTDSADQIEKMDRNQKKLDEVRLAYDDSHQRLMSDLARLWDSERQKKMGPLLFEFVRQERAMAAAYADALANIKV